MMEPEEPSLLDRIEGLPEEMQDELFNYLEYGEVLRLRRVCNRFRHIAEAHLRSRLPNSYLKINFHLNKNKCLSEFKCMRFSEDFFFPKVSFFHEDEDDSSQVWKELLQNPDLDWFLENYAPYVKELHLETLQLPIYNNAKQLKFLESFTNLEVFECSKLHLPCLELWNFFLNSEKPCTFPVFVPNSFKSLKRLLIESVKCSEDDESPTLNDLNRFWIFVRELMKTTVLEELYDPFVVVQDNEFYFDNVETRMKTIGEVIESWKKLDESLGQFYLDNLCDFVNDADIRRDLEIDQFLPFFQLCAESNIIFEGVQDTFFHSSMGDQFTKYVGSMISGFPKDLLIYNYENLEAAEFRISKLSNFINQDGTLKCPKLRGLSLRFLRRGCQEDHMYERLIADRLLIHDTQLPRNLTSLNLQFDVEIPDLVIPLGLSCANLTYLSLKNYAAQSSSFLQLWEGLPHLEHLKLSGCANLDDTGFLGENPQEPAILQLKNLKFLELTNLNRMSRVTDKTLKDAIRHIKLRCFRLMSYGCTRKTVEYYHLLNPHIERFQSVGYSSKQISSNNISLDGIRSLKTGVFAETIEKFDLFGLKIDNVPAEALNAVEKEFRSWHF